MDQQVVGGTIEADFQFPWVIDVSGTLTGKGVLIAPTWVLTAAHVVETSFGGVRVSYSRTDPNTGKVSGGNQSTAAGSVIAASGLQDRQSLRGPRAGATVFAVRIRSVPPDSGAAGGPGGCRASGHHRQHQPHRNAAAWQSSGLAWTDHPERRDDVHRESRRRHPSVRATAGPALSRRSAAPTW